MKTLNYRVLDEEKERIKTSIYDYDLMIFQKIKHWCQKECTWVSDKSGERQKHNWASLIRLPGILFHRGIYILWVLSSAL